jgi:death on curing protein
MDDIEFLTYDELLELHREQLDLFGGSDGIIDDGVVRSSLAQPSARAFGQYLHDDIAHMAAAYLFHFAANQGFVDGNKRIALASAVTFLAMNAYELTATNDEAYDATMSVATGQWDKTAVADWIRTKLSPIT